MKWLGRRGSGNIEDRRGFSGGGIAMGGGIVGLIIYLLVSFLGGSEGVNLGEGFQAQEGATEGVVATGDNAEDESAQFAAVVLADNEDVWNKIFAEKGADYREPVMVLYRDATSSACGSAHSAVGPFIARPTRRST